VVILKGESRLSFHGIDRIMLDSSQLVGEYIEGGGRVNLTLRRVNPA
jgi:alkylated DNA repair protein (DNA oxidative demethylase)